MYFYLCVHIWASASLCPQSVYCMCVCVCVREYLVPLSVCVCFYFPVHVTPYKSVSLCVCAVCPESRGALVERESPRSPQTDLGFSLPSPEFIAAACLLDFLSTHTHSHVISTSSLTLSLTHSLTHTFSLQINRALLNLVTLSLCEFSSF